MRVLMSIDGSFIKDLSEGKTVGAKTFWNNPYSVKAYELLKEKSNLDEFFFAFKLTEETDLDSVIANIPCKSNIVELEIPSNERTFEMGYYNFSDLIYYFDCAGEEELEEGNSIINEIKNNQMSGKVEDNNELTRELIQVNFSKIKPEWLRGVYSYDEIDYLASKLSI